MNVAGAINTVEMDIEKHGIDPDDAVKIWKLALHNYLVLKTHTERAKKRPVSTDGDNANE